MKRSNVWKFRYRSLSLQKKMLLFLVPVLIFFLVTTFAIYAQTRKSLKEAVLSSTELNFDLTVTEWNTKMQEVKNYANQIAARSTIKSYINSLESQTSIETVLQKDIYGDLFNTIVRSDCLQSIFVVKNNTQFVSCTPFQFDAGTELITSIYNLKTIDHSFYSFSIDEDTTYFCFIQKLYNQSDRNKHSYVVLVLKQEYAKILIKKYASKDIDYLISDEQSNVFYATHGASINSDNFHHIMQSDKKIIETNEQIIVHEFLKDSTYSLIATISKANLFQELIHYQRWTIITNIGTCFLLIIAILSVFRTFSKRIDHLNQTMDLVAQGNYTTRSEFKADDEISLLGKKLNNMLDNLQTMVINASLRELELRKAQIDTMRYQISPHFMYNTLETIRMIAKRNQDDLVSDIIKQLSKMLRYSTESSAWVSVRDEISQIERYLYIQGIRFKSKFSASLEIDPTLCDLKIPKLLLQPLIENAFKHGVEPKTGFSKLIITGSRVSQGVQFRIQDTGVGMNETMQEHISQYIRGDRNSGEHLGIGLRNVIDRIRLYYGSAGRIQIDSQYGLGTTILIEIPILSNDEDDGND